MYYIYHIPGVKIGCTKDLEKRMSDQEFTEWQILETHEDIHVASDREIELQKEYNYKVDKIPYWKSLQNRYKWKGNEGPGFNDLARENSKKVSRAFTMEQAEEIRKKHVPGKYGSIASLAKEYGVVRATIERIIYNITYN